MANKRRINIHASSFDLRTQHGWSAIYEDNGQADPATGHFSTTPVIFRQGGALVRLDIIPGGTPTVSVITHGKLKNRSAKVTFWFKRQGMGENANDVEVPPPDDVIKNMLDEPVANLSLPALDGVIEVPTFGSDARLHYREGYNRNSRLYLAPRVRIAPVPEKPTDVEVQSALDRLLGPSGAFSDFPYSNRQSDLAHVLAAILQTFIRPLIHGPTPFYLIDKASRRTGATTLAASIARIALGGRDYPKTVIITGKNEEVANRLTAVLKDVPAVLLADNIEGTINSAAVFMAITEPRWSHRILGRSETIDVPIRCLWLGTGNNPKMDDQMTPRTIRIRLDAKRPDPENREFLRQRYNEWLTEEIPALLHAALTLCQAWIVAGRPMGEVRTLNFPSWSSTMDGVFHVLGVKGFLTNLDSMHKNLDDGLDEWRDLTAAWWERFKGIAVKAGAIVELMDGIESPIDLGAGESRLRAQKLHTHLKKMEDRHFGDYRITRGEYRDHSNSWCLRLWDEKTRKIFGPSAGGEETIEGLKPSNWEEDEERDGN